jgi:hypothetical protein
LTLAIDGSNSSDDEFDELELVSERRRSVDLVIRSSSKCAERRWASLIAGLLLLLLLLLKLLLASPF